MNNSIKFRGLFSLLALALLLVSACQQKEPIDKVQDLGYDYFPSEINWEKTYLVDSIFFNDNTQSSDTFQFILKEETAGFEQAAGLEKHQVLKRSAQFSATQNWEPRSSIFVLKTAQNLQWVEDNQRIIKLVFPIDNIQSWNGNALNAQGRRNFIWQKLNSNHVVLGTNYTETITVLEARINNLIEEILISSTYAKNIGLIDYTNNQLNFQTSGISGYKVRQQLISFKRL
jgi:hypothetical protein